MKTTILLALMVAGRLVQAQSFSWVDQFGGTLTDDIKSMVTDAGGNSYVTGQFQGTMDADPGPGIFNLTSAGGSDTYIAKISPAGILIWAKQIGGTSTYTGEGGNGIAVGPTGYIYVTGRFVGLVDFDPGASQFYLQSTAPYYESCAASPDVFVLKLSADGDFIWAAQVGGNGYDEAAAIVLSSNEEVYVTGEYVSEYNVPVDFDPTPGTFYLTPLSGAGAFMLKMDADGNFAWAKQWYASGISASGCGLRDALFHPVSLCLDNTGNVFCTGDFSSTVDFDPDQGVYSIGTTSNAAFVLKLTSGGGFQWARALNSAGNHAYGKDVVVAPNGNVHSVGAFDGTMDFDPGAGTRNLKAPGGSGTSGIGPADGYVWILSASGDYVWAGQLGGNTDDRAKSVDLDGTGNIYVTGEFTGTADFNPSSAKNTLKSAGGTDAFVLKLTTSGGYVWAVRLGGTSGESATALDIDPFGSILTSGMFQGTADFDPSSGTYSVSSFGSSDAFVHKMTQSGGAIASPSLPDAPGVVRSTVFPNPTRGVSSLVLQEYREDVSVRIFSMTGELIHEQLTSGYKIPLDFSTYQPGMYVVQVMEGQATAIHKIIRGE